MAGQKELEIIQRGVEAWNEWRQAGDQDSLLPNLREANLQQGKRAIRSEIARHSYP